MLLGVLLHATIAYKVDSLPSWPHDKNFHHGVFDGLYLLIHSFRMPLFFLIAGYFCRFLFLKIGEKEFIKHRTKRILIPFIGSMIVILPFTIYPFLVYQQSLDPSLGWNEIFRRALRQLFHWNGMAHLWFLYYLLIYYCAVLGLSRLGKIDSVKRIVAYCSRMAGNIRPGAYAVLLLATIPVWLILGMGPHIFLHVSTGILPAPEYLLFFGYFFLVGWWINRSPASVFSWMASHRFILMIAGLMLSVLTFWADFSGYFAESGAGMQWLIKAVAAVQASCLVCGSIGIFLKSFHAESKVWKYFADASYWIYLIHLGVVAALQVLFMHIEMPGILKFPLLLVLTVAIALLTYHYLVRFTIIGRYLHGERKQTAHKKPESSQPIVIN
jgi:glucan biosynthesis protein C